MEEILTDQFKKEETWRLESLVSQFKRMDKESVTNTASGILRASISAATKVLNSRKEQQELNQELVQEYYEDIASGL